jgi:hypothetical protein
MEDEQSTEAKELYMIIEVEGVLLNATDGDRMSL